MTKEQREILNRLDQIIILKQLDKLIEKKGNKKLATE